MTMDRVLEHGAHKLVRDCFKSFGALFLWMLNLQMKTWDRICIVFWSFCTFIHWNAVSHREQNEWHFICGHITLVLKYMTADRPFHIHT